MPVDGPAKYCSQCGHDLQEGPEKPPHRTTVYFGILALVAIVLSAVALWQSRINQHPRTETTKIPAEREQKNSDPVVDSRSGTPLGTTSIRMGEMELPLGTLIIEDIAGSLIHEAPAPVVDNGWIAVPLRLGRGGFRWRVFLPDDGETTIEGGIFRDFDTIGLWQVSPPVPVQGPELHA